MQFITGGAFNGKSKWVKAYNGINEENCHWFSFYQNELLPYEFDLLTKNIVAIEGLEQWVKVGLVNDGEENVRKTWQNILAQWNQWEKTKDRKVIIIGTDITKGIVPMSEEERIWRDTTGRVFQDTAAISKNVFQVWYGIHKMLK